MCGSFVALVQLIQAVRTVVHVQNETIGGLRATIESKDDDFDERLEKSRTAIKQTYEKSKIALLSEIAELHARQTEPDVSLEFMAPGPMLLRNFGAPACEVRISPINIRRSSVSFPFVADLHSEPMQIEPQIMPPPRPSPTGWVPHQDILTFLNAAAREAAIGVLTGAPDYSSQLVDEMVSSRTEPLDFELVVSYQDREKNHTWEKRETLRFVPNRRSAYVEHGTRRRIR